LYIKCYVIVLSLMTGEQDTYRSVCVMRSFNGLSKYTICIQE